PRFGWYDVTTRKAFSTKHSCKSSIPSPDLLATGNTMYYLHSVFFFMRGGNKVYTVLVEAVSTCLRMIGEHEFSGEVDYCLRCVVYCNQQTGILVSCGYPGSAAPWSCRRRTLLLPPSDHLCTVFLDAPMASADALLQPDYSAPVS
ncbi:hypothetical protein Hamer_G030244, partial [Homarus americanus]